MSDPHHYYILLYFTQDVVTEKAADSKEDQPAVREEANVPLTSPDKPGPKDSTCLSHFFDQCYYFVSLWGH